MIFTTDFTQKLRKQALSPTYTFRQPAGGEDLWCFCVTSVYNLNNMQLWV